jgi:hypothetical protein
VPTVCGFPDSTVGLGIWARQCLDGGRFPVLGLPEHFRIVWVGFLAWVEGRAAFGWEPAPRTGSGGQGDGMETRLGGLPRS